MSVDEFGKQRWHGGRIEDADYGSEGEEYHAEWLGWEPQGSEGSNLAVVRLRAFDTQGKLNWQREEKQEGKGTVQVLAWADGVYLLHGDWLYSFDKSGNELGRMQTQFDWPAEARCLVGHDGTLYYAGDQEVFAISKSATLEWRAGGFNVPRHPFGSLALSDSGLLHLAQSSPIGELFALNPEDGRTSWTTNTSVLSGSSGTSFNHSMVVGPDGTVHICDFGFNCYAVKPDGSLKWKHSSIAGLQIGPHSILGLGSDPEYYHAPAVDDLGRVFLRSDRGLTVLSSEGDVLLVDMRFKDIFVPMVFGPDGKMYLIDNGILYCLRF